MTRKPNFVKLMLGVAVLALLFIGTWATTRAPQTSAAKGKITTNFKNNITNARLNLARAVPLPTPSWDAVFEIEGNAFDDSGTPLPDDWSTLWNNPIPVGTSGSINGVFGGSEAATFVSDPPIRTDLIYTGGGSKDFNQISDWGQVARGTGPSKDDVEHAFAAKYTNPTDSHSIIVFGGDRPTNNGDANIGFWFFQNPVAPNSSGGFSSLHKNGDVFVLSAFSGGGGTSSIRTLVWVGQPDGPPDTGALARCNALSGVIDPKSDTTAFPQGSLCDISGSHPNSGTGVTNSIGVPVSWQYTNKDNKTTCTNPDQTATSPCVVPTPDFFEGAIDITSLGLASECFASFLLETRSSAEVSAVLKDFALGNFQACSGSCNKTASPSTVCEDPANPGFGLPVTLTYETSSGGGTLNETLHDDNGTPANTGDDFYITGGLTVSPATPGTCTTGSSPVTIQVLQGQTLRCTLSVADPVGSTTDTLVVHEVNGLVIDCTDTATVTVNPNPTATAEPNQTANCVTAATTAFTLAGTSTNGTGVWSVVSGPAVIDSQSQIGNAVGASVTFTGTGSAILRLTTTSASCGTATSDLTLTVTPAVGVTINHLSGCDTSGATTETLTATTSGGTGPLGFQWSGGSTATTQSISVGVGTYTVTVTDANGCTSQATRKIGLCSD